MVGTGKQDHSLQATGGPAGPVVLTPLKQREPSFKSPERKVNIEQLLLDHTGFSVVFFPQNNISGLGYVRPADLFPGMMFPSALSEAP